MTTTNVWGVPVIGAGDGLLEAWKLLADTGIRPNVPVASVAAARTLLTQAEAQGIAPTSTTPAYFDINGIIYRSTGEKNGGVWVLAPINETEVAVGKYGGGTITRESGAQHALITSTLPSRPYDRIVTAQGMVNASVSGTIGLRILILNTGGATSRWATGSSAETQLAINSGVVPAGADPQVILALSFGGTGNSTATISTAADANRLIVEAKPITMD